MPANDWRDLAVIELLVAVGDHGSIGVAAAAVGMAQPNASRALRRLERRVGVPLLERSPRGTTLTPEAALIVDWGRATLEAAGRLRASMAALGATGHDHLRVAASQTVAEYLLPGWLAHYRQRPHAAEVHLQVGNSGQVMEAVHAGSVDLGFVETFQLAGGLQPQLVGSDRLVVVVAPDHPWANRHKPLSGQDLADTALVVRERGSGTRHALEHALAQQNLTISDPVQALSSNAAVRVAAMAGVAPAVLSEHAVREPLSTGRLVRVPVDGINLVRPLHAMTRAGTRTTAAVDDLLQLARHHP